MTSRRLTVSSRSGHQWVPTTATLTPATPRSASLYCATVVLSYSIFIHIVFELFCFNCSTVQWSFRKTGTVRTLASQAEIGLLVQAPEALARVRGYHSRENFEIVYANPANNIVSVLALLAFLNTLTMGTAFPRVPSRNNPWHNSKCSYCVVVSSFSTSKSHHVQVPIQCYLNLFLTLWPWTFSVTILTSCVQLVRCSLSQQTFDLMTD